MLLADVRFELTLFQLMGLVKLPLLPICNNWWTSQDLNLKPAGYEPDALTIELEVHKMLFVFTDASVFTNY